MPQDGSNNYQYPPGTRGIPDETIESARYNDFIDDLRDNDLNIARPIHRGGTGATSADAALVNLSAEKAAQLVTNYDSHVWYPGSFRSAVGATGAPVVDHAFSGIVYINEPLTNPPTNNNVTVSARDMNDTVVPSRVYVREKKAGVWGAWTVIDASTLPFTPVGGLEATTILEAIQELDTEKASIVYVDATKVAKTGDTMTGALTLYGDAAAPLEPVTKQQLEATLSAIGTPASVATAIGMQINGSFDVNEENVAITSVNGGYICDGWRLLWSGATMIPRGSRLANTQINFPGVNTYLNIYSSPPQASLGGFDFCAVDQPIEGWRVARLRIGQGAAMQPFTIAFWSAHARTGIYSVAFRNDETSSSYIATYTQAAANVPQYNTITVPTGAAGINWWIDERTGLRVTFVVAAGSSLIRAPNSWFTGTSHIAGTGQVNGIGTDTDFFRISNVIILPGIYAPIAADAYKLIRSLDQEMMICHRYFQSIPNIVMSGYNIAGGYIHQTVPHTIPMRATPISSFILGAGFINSTELEFAWNNRSISVVRFRIVETGYGSVQFYMTANARL